MNSKKHSHLIILAKDGVSFFPISLRLLRNQQISRAQGYRSITFENYLISKDLQIIRKKSSCTAENFKTIL